MSPWNWTEKEINRSVFTFFIWWPISWKLNLHFRRCRTEKTHEHDLTDCTESDKLLLSIIETINTNFVIPNLQHNFFLTNSSTRPPVKKERKPPVIFVQISKLLRNKNDLKLNVDIWTMVKRLHKSYIQTINVHRQV